MFRCLGLALVRFHHFNALHAAVLVVSTAIACGDTVAGHEDPATDTADTHKRRAVDDREPSLEPDAPAPDRILTGIAPEDGSNEAVEPPMPMPPTREEPSMRARAESPPPAATPEAPPANHEDSSKPAAAETPSKQPEWPEDCEQRVVLRAHGASRSGDTSPYAVDAGEERVAQFFFQAGSQAPAQMLKAVFQLDNAQIVHHWALYALNTQQLQDGQVLSDGSLLDVLRLVGDQLIVSGGPGASPLELPPNIGLRLPRGEDVGLVLEVHYFNASTATAEDRSGIELCVTSKPRPIEAAVHGLGRSSFKLPPHQLTDVVGTCVPRNQREPVHILAITPHMHARGVHAKVVLNRESGEALTLVDQPFDWREQRTYPQSGGEAQQDVILQPGDTLTSTCSYENATDSMIAAGGAVDEEMCGMLTLAWPAGVLQNGSDLGRLFLLPDDADCLVE